MINWSLFFSEEVDEADCKCLPSGYSSKASMSSGKITVVGSFSCFDRLTITSDFRYFGTETTGVKCTAVSFHVIFMQVGTICQIKAFLLYRHAGLNFR